MSRFLDDGQVLTYQALLGRETLKAAVNETLETVRGSHDGVPPFDVLRDRVVLRLVKAQFAGLVAVINATGILLHTNLGRAPLPPSALQAMREAGAGYSNLEYDLLEGKRGSRYSRASGLLAELTGAQDALVVNNCAAAVLLIVDTYARDREVVSSRGELVEIGGGFRVPDVLERAGARLIEVGTTNKTYLHDYERALSPRTALLLRTHSSNYRVQGFTHAVDPKELGALGRRAGVPVVEDLGSGALVDLAQFGLPHERTVQEAISDGADLVAFSGDKLLGGPQAGVIVGTRAALARLRTNPLLRALRADKITFAALAATLRCYLDPQLRRTIPLYGMLEQTPDDLRARALRYTAQLPGAQIEASTAYAGGGTLPHAAIESIAVAPRFTASASLASAALRAPRSGKPIVARVHEDRLLVDLRTVAPDQDAAVIESLTLLNA